MNFNKSMLGVASFLLIAMPSYAQSPFLTGFALNSPRVRSDFAGLVGMTLTVSGNALTVSQVGRICLAGNAGVHTVKFVLASTGVDVPNGTASVNMSGCTAGQFVYAPLGGPGVTLSANTAYHLVSQEVSPGDTWYDSGTVAPAGDAVVNNSVYFNGSSYAAVGGVNSSYVPPNFLYTVPNPVFVTSYNLNNRPLRSDYTGFVGMQLTMGANPISLLKLGRLCTPGNSQTHTVKFAFASNSADVPNATAQVNMAGCVPGSFVYVTLGSPVTLTANTSYYLLSQETSGQDQWYDFGTLTSTNVATVNSAAYGLVPPYSTVGSTNTSYVPPNFQYGPPPPPDCTPITVSVGTNPGGLSFSVDSTPYNTSPQTFNNWNPCVAHTISTTSPQPAQPPVSGTQQAFSNWSDGGAISHTIPIGSSTSSFTANFKTQYLLITSVAPANSGTVVANPPSASGYYDSGTVVQLTAVANSGFQFDHWNGDLSGTVNPQSLTMSAQHSATANFVPPTDTPFLTGFALNSPSLRNDFAGLVGMKLTVGSAPLTVTSVGRVCAPGPPTNSQTHLVKFVLASNSTDVSGGSASVDMTGCVVNQFKYVLLGSPITLAANTSYYLVSQEFSLGDRWYDYGTVTSTGDAAVNSSVYFNGGSSSYALVNGPNSSYVPPNFRYNTGPCNAISVNVGTNPAGLSFSVDSTPYNISPQTFNWTTCQTHTISTTSPQNVASGTQTVFTNWSDAGSISHTVSPQSSTSFTANFTTQYLLTTNVSPANGGSIGRNPSSATGYYDAGTVVQLTATPSNGSSFINWSGDLSTNANPTSVTMSAARTVTANFTQPTITDTPFLTGFTSTSRLRNEFGGLVGMRLTVGGADLPVTAIGRICISGNSQTHTVKFVLASSGVDVAGATAQVNMTGCTAGQFTYVPPSQPVTLLANTAYYLVSQEFAGGDQWYDSGAVSSTPDAAVNSSIYFNGTSYAPVNSSNTSYVPPNFKYVPPTSVPIPFVTSFNLDHPFTRNEFSGFVGMKFTVGAVPIAVTSIGRVCVSGNNQIHTVELVNASTNAVVGSVSVNMTGCTPDQFKYVALPNIVNLLAGGSYYLASMEAAGGDQWYNLGALTTSNAGNVTSAIYFSGGVWNPSGSANSSYVPPNFLYVPRGTPIIEVFSSQAPNAFGSPSWSGYFTNAISALQNGQTAIGNPSSDPTAYFQVSGENQFQNIVSDFHSWLGSASPSGLFANELGNRLHFGLHILGNGKQFSLSGLHFDMESTDAGNIFQDVGDFSDGLDPANNYTPYNVGINYGADRVKGGTDDVLITSGTSTQMVDELIYVGIGNAPAPSDFGCLTGTSQDMLNCTASYYVDHMPFNITTTYKLFDSSNIPLAQGSATVSFIAVSGGPGPTSASVPGTVVSHPKGRTFK